ncbi:MAG: chloride channel protein [Flavobacterium sp.]|uniref:chloride channel protein n=1 Tax=Flavobacterium sp. TaxID=239 RepID=UPI0032675922
MSRFIKIKKTYQFIVFQKLVLVSVLIGFLSSFLAISLKKITEYYESIFLLRAFHFHFYYFLFPLIGLTIIYFLRKYLFKNKENKGIKEIFDCTKISSKNLPAYKIPSHFINGFFTVIFGGSTGIEVSTVVASATIGSLAQQKTNFLRKYKTQLMCAGIAAGITALFASPIAGVLFSIEVISRKINKALLLTNIIAVCVASMLVYVLDEPTLFTVKISMWNTYAIPYFIILGVLAGINSVFLTKSVLFFKSQFLKINKIYNKIFIATFIIGSSILVLPILYGDGYHGVKEIFLHSNDNFTFKFFLSILGVLIFKPIVTSVTLSSGGDGGVFAPSLVIGAFLGFFVATFLNTFFNANVLPINFIIIGMAALLSASIHAPFTALFLVCSLVNDYTLFVPILMVCLISKYTAKYMYPYTVYSYTLNIAK